MSPIKQGMAHYYAQSSFREKLEAQATGKAKGRARAVCAPSQSIWGRPGRLWRPRAKPAPPWKCATARTAVIICAKIGLALCVDKEWGIPLFYPIPDDDPGWIITQYRAKDPVGDSFKLLKDPELIRWRPCRHWTDAKIRVYEFCRIMALLIIRVMELKAANAGLRMSPAVLKRERDDLREITMLYDRRTAETKVSARSSMQQSLWEPFNLQPLEDLLTLHKANAHPKE